MTNLRWIVVLPAMLWAWNPLWAAQSHYEWQSGKWVATAAPAPGTPAGELAQLRELYDQGKYSKVVKAADKFDKDWPDADQREEAMLLAGRSEMHRGRYYQAFEWFEKQTAAFPNGEQFDRALYFEYQAGDMFLLGKKRIVLGFICLPAVSDGIDILQRIAEHAPGSAIADKSLMRVAEYDFTHQKFEDAVSAYDSYLSMFPKSRKAAYATLQAARSTLSSYRGLPYDLTPLLDAQQRFRGFREQYPEAAVKANVIATLAGIHDQRAQEDFVTAQFYQRLNHRVAAAFYYRQVIRRYSDTEWAKKARAALEQLGPLKEEPRQFQVAPGAIEPSPSEQPVPVEQAPTPKPATRPAENETPMGPTELERLIPTTAPGKME
jgi:outer membrane assembly lipoprotein YfiO